MEVRKRKPRAVLSCNDCRRRKLKCDRGLPCNRCVGGGYAERCGYNFVEGEEGGESVAKRARTVEDMEQRDTETVGARNNFGSSQVLGALLRHGEAVGAREGERVARLERHLAELQEVVRRLADRPEDTNVGRTRDEDHGGADTTAGGGNGQENLVASVGLFKGKGVRTFYYGPTSPITIVAHFSDLRPFMKRVFVGSTLQKLRQDTKAQEDRWRAKQIANRVLTMPSLRSLLPDRETVDKVVKTYFDTFETTYRILHGPIFWKAYANYWYGTSEADSAMDAIILAILACTLCTSTHETTRYNSNGSSFRSKAVIWLKACEAWLKGQSNKRRTLASLQVRLLRLLALSTTCLKTKEYYQEVQAHMGFMISSGMHRDPGMLGNRCSIFEAEMRRRLWATSMELEMQASIDKGTSSILSSLQHDCAAPRNINDLDIHSDIKYLPESHNDQIFTDTSYLHHSVRSLPHRAELLTTADSLHSLPPFTETMQAEQDIQNDLDSIPKWDDARASMTSTLLDLQLRQFLVIIHTHRALSAEARTRKKSEYHYAIVTLLEACEALIERHTRMIEANNFALCCLRFDYLRAAFLICHVAYYASPSSDTFTTRIAKPAFEATKMSALRLLEERSMRPGRGNHHFWYLSAAISLVETQYRPEDIQMLEGEASERVCALLYRMLALQDEDEVGQPAEVILGDSGGRTVMMNTPVSFIEPHPGPPVDDSAFNMAEAGLEAGLEAFAGPDVNAWTLNDFWFMDEFEGGLGQSF
ncbi:hypothetical protein BU23DRAFT_469893 [Bimuria novae-zelandiae CBS 107.79]|uniref:Zn(2)-C6 fungal-type domain-containing protein n=1 Tax=Bimuria novae-zelandiae CBS 107.79 TaxID=1447943 RepID=A0A6A5V9Q4_9PLEO|nr:hypothetical protein BU23DRAFT_469893 [Bimuria novae-zelandiae CBS 107.79]